METKPIYELILWNNCCNNCKFCWQKRHRGVSSQQGRLDALEQARKFIEGEFFENGSHLLLVGGELFDSTSSQIDDALLETYDFISKKMSNGDVGLLYINTNLLYDVGRSLIPILNLFKDNGQIDRLRFTTSYDVYGRFDSGSKERMFLSNLGAIATSFTEMRKVVNIIMTKQMCEYHLGRGGKFSFVRKFRDGFDCDVNLLPYVAVNDAMTPCKSEVFSVLRNESMQNRGYIEKYIGNFDLKQEKRIFDFSSGAPLYASADVLSCGHGMNFTKYSTSNSCFVCDLKELFNA